MPANNEIGAKIKGLRQMRGVSVEDLAERSHLTVDQINQIEAGAVTTGLTPLLGLARGLGVRLGTFLDDAELYGPVVSRAGQDEQKAVRFSGAQEGDGLSFHALASNKADRSMEPFVINVHPPKDKHFELSSHEGEEFIYVLEGKLEVVHGKEHFSLGVGDSIYYDSIVPHHVHSAPDVETKILAVICTPH